MNDEPIPLITYVLVTITSFVLAYASIDNDNELQSNVAPMLDNTPTEEPISIQNNNDDSISPIVGQPIQNDVPIVNAVPIESDITKVGGKKKTKSINEKLNKSKKNVKKE
tara:strand:- start:4280 stop:4609 length:330 start_codon:yes stop_codon:yes gene_type:complete